jgi:hypothetical protein
MSFYSNSKVREREARENKNRQMQEELERRERVRKSLSYSAKDARRDEVREIEQARDAYQQEFQKYYSKMRESVMVQPDVDGFFVEGPALDCDPAVALDIHWNLFLKDHPDFYNSEENRDTLSQYFKVNNCFNPDRWIYSAAYKRLLSLGLLETEASQEPVIHEQPTPEPVKVDRPGEPIRFDDEGPVYSVHTYNFESKFAKRDDRIEGRNPENGFAWVCTKTELDRMSADNFKRFASITKEAQSLTGLSSDYGQKYMG